MEPLPLPCDGDGVEPEPPWGGDDPEEPPCEGSGTTVPPWPPGQECGSRDGTQSGFFTSSASKTDRDIISTSATKLSSMHG
jgi:hypothetical protein